MNTQEKNIKIAEFCGYTDCDYADPSDAVAVFEGQICEAPNFCNSLDAVAQAEAMLTNPIINGEYRDCLTAICEQDFFAKEHWSGFNTHATARQRVDALLSVLSVNGMEGE